ncbi:uncharacterized protein METZ01_LOCUS183777, partial [marine metagenome]
AAARNSSRTLSTSSSKTRGLTKPSKTGEELKGEDQQGAESEVTDISNS